MHPRSKTLQPTFSYNPAQRIVQKNLIDDQRQPMPRANLLQPRPLPCSSRMPRRIVRMHHHNRLRPRPNPPLQLRKVDPPPIVIKQWIRPQSHILQIRQKIEQRIARLPHQHLIPRIAKQPKQIPIPFTGTGGQYHRIRIDTSPMPRVIPRHRLPSRPHPPRIGIISQPLNPRQRPKNPFSVIPKPTNRRVRHRQIHQPPPRSPRLSNSSRKPTLPTTRSTSVPDVCQLHTLTRMARRPRQVVPVKKASPEASIFSMMRSVKVSLSVTEAPSRGSTKRTIPWLI